MYVLLLYKTRKKHIIAMFKMQNLIYKHLLLELAYFLLKNKIYYNFVCIVYSRYILIIWLFYKVTIVLICQEELNLHIYNLTFKFVVCSLKSCIRNESFYIALILARGFVCNIISLGTNIVSKQQSHIFLHSY